jgi:aspartyl aminopeptidase
VASKCLSADVTAAYDPNFADVYEKRNSSMISCGTTLSKFTGARGKSSTNDASAEFVGFVRRILNEAGVAWQTAELGKIDAGGGGTVAKYISCHNIETVDIGVPVISMHAPYEVISKADLYATHLAFVAFIR